MTTSVCPADKSNARENVNTSEAGDRRIIIPGANAAQDGEQILGRCPHNAAAAAPRQDKIAQAGNGLSAIPPETREAAFMNKVLGAFNCGASGRWMRPWSPINPFALRIFDIPTDCTQPKPKKDVVGIVCGEPPHHLCAVGFRPEAYSNFMAANPELKTITTQLPGLVDAFTIVWLQAPDQDYPNQDFGDAVWISKGVIPVAAPEFDARKFISHPGPVARIVDLSTLKWPSKLEDYFWLAKRERKWGPRYLNSRKGRPVLNATFWAHFFAERNEYKFIVETRKHVICHKGDYYQPELEKMIEGMMRFLYDSARLDPEFPHDQLRVSVARKCVKRLEIVAAYHTRDDAAFVDSYVKAMVEKARGYDLTVVELFSRLRESCEESGLPPFHRRVFCRLIAAPMRKYFGVLKSNDIPMEGQDGVLHARRGFHGVRFKAQKPESSTGTDVADAADAADVPDGTTQNAKNCDAVNEGGANPAPSPHPETVPAGQTTPSAETAGTQIEGKAQI